MGTQNQGWKGEPGLHAKAGKGEKASGKGWHGHTKAHAKTAKGEDTKPKGIIDKLKGD